MPTSTDHHPAVRDAITETNEYHWEIHYHGGRCKFEHQDPEIGLIYDLEVPEPVRNQGIGSAVLSVAIQTLTESGANEVHAQIGAADGATQHVLEKHCFDTQVIRKRKPDRIVVDGVKRVERPTPTTPQ
jgi:GNAT superfamily N-acetyltransferase